MLIPKVLLVNDDPATLLALEALLTEAAQRANFEVVTALSGEEALRQVLTQDFAVILLDVKMPGMDGFETAEAIHSHPRSASVPIIFTTAYYGDEVNRLKGYQNGAVDYLFTPVIPQVLQTKVSVFIDLARKRIELESKTRELETLNQDLRVQQVHELKRINAALEREVTVRRKAEQRAHDLATRDPLTRLPNRRSLIEHLEHAVAHAARHHEHLGLLFIDLDKFKSINDTLGHEAGDDLLIQFSARVAASVRESDMVARLGGDEFVVLLEGLSEAADAGTAAKKILQAVEQPYRIGTHSIKIAASIGISLFPFDATSAHGLMKNADTAMYHAKKLTPGSFCFYKKNLHMPSPAKDEMRR